MQAVVSITPLHARTLDLARWPITVMLVFYLWFFNWRANMDAEEMMGRYMFSRFWMQPLLPLLLIAAVGLCEVWSWVLLAMQMRVRPALHLVMMLFVMSVLIMTVSRNYHHVES